MVATGLTKRGSRAWFEQKLNAIEASGVEQARALAASKWASIVWQDPSEAGGVGADWIERFYKLTGMAASLQDGAAKSKIESILSGDDDAIIRLANLLDDKKIKEAVRAQGMDEERIRNLAACYQDPTDPARKKELRIRRNLRSKTKRAIATINMTLGLIGRDGHHYATAHELALRNQQKRLWAKFGESITLRRGDESVSMLDVMKSAGKKKFAETYALTKGLESYAKAAGLTWAFLTLTAPPRMHPNPSNGHSTWDGTTPDAAHKWIHDAYHKAEVRLRTTHGIVISGLRVVEPHRDGCPHCHVLIFAPANEMQIIEDTFRQQPEWKTEAGMKFALDDGRASAASYAFKYITKTIGSVEQLSGEHGSVDAWRSTWGIRAFQFFGLPARGLWRRLREVKECPEEALLAGLWRAAHRGDGHAFIGLAGGLNCKQSERPVISKTSSDSDKKTIDFILRETGESIHFNFRKWEQTRKPKAPEANKNEGIEVILNYPRKPNPTPTGQRRGLGRSAWCGVVASYKPMRDITDYKLYVLPTREGYFNLIQGERHERLQDCGYNNAGRTRRNRTLRGREGRDGAERAAALRQD